MTTKKNTRAKTRGKDNPYEVYFSADGWIWRVVKHYQRADKERENRYARVMAWVASPYTYGDYEVGDVYCRDIPGYNWYWDNDDKIAQNGIKP